MSNAAFWPSARRTSLGVGTGEGTTVTADVTAHTKGAWVTLGTASGPLDRLGLHVANVSAARFRLDIAYGAAGSEIIVVSDLFFDMSAAGRAVFVELPLSCADGQTIRARASSSTSSGSLRVMLNGYAFDGYKMPVARSMEALNAFTNTDPTPQVTLNGTTFTAWAEIVASTATAYRALMATPGTGGDTTRSQVRGIVQIGIGAAGGEAVLWEGQISSSTGSLGDGVIGGMIYGSVPAASRLAVRARAHAASTDTLAFAVMGLRG